MNIKLVLRSAQRRQAIDLRRFRKLSLHLLQEGFDWQEGTLAVHLVGAREMTRLNEGFLGHNGTTDVITFDYAESGAALSGEVFICVDEALAQARRFRTTWQLELVRYLIHGLLHLNGYDDSRASQRRAMKRAEDRLLRRAARTFRLAELSRKGIALPLCPPMPAPTLAP